MDHPTGDDLLDDLTPAQHDAVTHYDGPLLILAGAGSGKTRVITRRVAWLLREGVKAWQILAITFTNKAAGEMRQRVEALAPGNRVFISTFHSLGARLIRQYADRLGLESDFTIYDMQERNQIVKAALDAADVDNVRFTPDRIGGAISKAKNQLLAPEKYASQATDFFTQTVARVYPFYEKKLRAANAVDFDDLLFWPALVLKHDPELRAELDARFKFVLIDEYQDTNQAQYAIARGLSVDQPNLCVVGDPDQSIYKWRGSDIKNILDFERDFPGAKVITLERNYRSTRSILQAASHVIAHNRQRKPKTLTTENPQGRPVTVLTFETSEDEADGIVRRIRSAVDGSKNGPSPRKYRDFAIFLRINALTRGLESAFVRLRVPFQIVKGLAFFERKENRDVLAYLRLLVNPRDDMSFVRVVNEPARGIGKVSIDHLRAYAEPRELSLLAAAAEVAKVGQIKGKALAGLRDFAALMADLRPLAPEPPADVIDKVLDRTGYRQMLKDSRDEDDQERLANIEELVTAARQFSAQDSSASLSNFLENITLASDLDGWDEQQDCVSVMTLHSSKGLEFPVVYVMAVEEGLLPHERSLQNNEELEEERRLAFVGMTRAKEELYLTHSRLREFRGKTLYAVPSTFLSELPADGVEHIDMSVSGGGTRRAMDEWRGGNRDADPGWEDAGVAPRREPKSSAPAKPAGSSAAGDGDAYAEGMIVSHAVYGTGRVTDVSGYGALRKIKIRFSAHGEKTFIADKVKLTIVKKG